MQACGAAHPALPVRRTHRRFAAAGEEEVTGDSEPDRAERESNVRDQRCALRVLKGGEPGLVTRRARAMRAARAPIAERLHAEETADAERDDAGSTRDPCERASIRRRRWRLEACRIDVRRLDAFRFGGRRRDNGLSRSKPSRKKRAVIDASRAWRGSRSFYAPRIPLRCVAAYTAAMPPCPIKASRRHLPRSVCPMRDVGSSAVVSRFFSTVRSTTFHTSSTTARRIPARGAMRDWFGISGVHPRGVQRTTPTVLHPNARDSFP